MNEKLRFMDEAFGAVQCPQCGVKTVGLEKCKCHQLKSRPVTSK